MRQLEILGFDKDLVIAGDDGKMYHISREKLAECVISAEQYASLEYKAIRKMLSQGTALALVPTQEEILDNEGKEIEEFGILSCYLVNLSCLKATNFYEEEAERVSDDRPDFDYRIAPGVNLNIDPIAQSPDGEEDDS